MKQPKVEIDEPVRFQDIVDTIHRKPSLKRIYSEIYAKYAECLAKCPKEGVALELGSGASFVNQILPDIKTSDVIRYPGLDYVVDATKMPFAENSLRAIFMFDVFHHIPDVESFFAEADRCLKPGGRIFIVDQFLGVFSTPILKYIHHEPFHPESRDWKFQSTGPLSGANGALTWMVFERDLTEFKSRFPRLHLEGYTPHTPLRYWLAGGLKKWSILPEWLFKFATMLDQFLTRITPKFASFVDVELVKIR